MLRTKLFERLLELGEVDLDDTERALAVEDTDEQEFLGGRRRARHEYLTLGAGVMHLVKRLAIKLSPKLAR